MVKKKTIKHFLLLSESEQNNMHCIQLSTITWQVNLG